jgi:hypothetical protein
VTAIVASRERDRHAGRDLEALGALCGQQHLEEGIAR